MTGNCVTFAGAWAGIWLRNEKQRPWLAARSAKTAHREQEIKNKAEGHSRFRLNSKMPDDNSGFLSVRIPVEPTYGGISPECRSPFCFVLQIPQTTVDTIINQEMTPVSIADIRHSITGSFEVYPLPLPASAGSQ